MGIGRLNWLINHNRGARVIHMLRKFSTRELSAFKPSIDVLPSLGPFHRKQILSIIIFGIFIQLNLAGFMLLE